MLTHKAINSLPSHCHLSGPAQTLPGCCYRADALSCPQHGPAAAGQIPPAPTSHGAGAAPAHPAARSCHARPCCASPGVPGVVPGTQPSPGPAGLQRLHVPVEPVPGNPPEQVPPRSGLSPQTLLLGHRPARPCLPRLLCPGSHAGRPQALGPVPAALCTTRLCAPRSCGTAGTSRGRQPAVHSPSKALAGGTAPRRGTERCSCTRGTLRSLHATSSAPLLLLPPSPKPGSHWQGAAASQGHARAPLRPHSPFCGAHPVLGAQGSQQRARGPQGQSCSPGLGTVAPGGAAWAWLSMH